MRTQKKIMNEKIRTLIAALAAVAVVGVGAVSLSQVSQANIIGDLFDYFNFSDEEVVQENGGMTNTTVTPIPDDDRGEELYQPALNYEQAVIAAVERNAPAVVSIAVTKELQVMGQCAVDPFSDFFGGQSPFQFYQPCPQGTERQEVGGGTGFIVTSDGMIVTNRHVVADEEAEYTVLTNDGKQHEAEVLARDPIQDLAIIKVDASGLPTVTLGSADSIKLGQTAIAIGNALGEFRNTVSVGVVSGLSRNIVASGGGGVSERLEGLIQTDAAINRGNSGGPLLNLRGEVIGVNVAMAVDAQNIGFAVPVDMAKRDIDSVQQTGEIRVPYLGVRYIALNEGLMEREDLPVSEGALLRGNEQGPAVIPGAPAAEAGLMAEDIITAVNGQEINANSSLVSLIQRYDVGEQISLTVLRNGRTIQVSVTLGSRE